MRLELRVPGDATLAYSSTGEGAAVFVTTGPAQEGPAVVLVVYPIGTVETYNLAIGPDGRGEVAVSVSKPGISRPPLGTIPARASVFVAKCSR
jgi:hypothetical protein